MSIFDLYLLSVAVGGAGVLLFCRSERKSGMPDPIPDGSAVFAILVIMIFPILNLIVFIVWLLLVVVPMLGVFLGKTLTMRVWGEK